jgi:predicted RNase H-like nuclease
MGSDRNWHLAQANIARMKVPIEDPLMEPFRAQLDAINALADASPGFVWRLQTAAGNATDIHAFDDPLLLFNMSVWRDVDALHAYTYRSAHAGPLRARREWFEAAKIPSFVLWWIPAARLPTIEEAKEKLKKIADRGPTSEAFTFRDRFPPPESPEAHMLPEAQHAP